MSLALLAIHVPGAQDQCCPVGLVDEENNEIAPGIRLARCGIDVFSDAIPVLHEPEPRAVEEDLFCFILVDVVL